MGFGVAIAQETRLTITQAFTLKKSGKVGLTFTFEKWWQVKSIGRSVGCLPLHVFSLAMRRAITRSACRVLDISAARMVANADGNGLLGIHISSVCCFLLGAAVV